MIETIVMWTYLLVLALATLYLLTDLIANKPSSKTKAVISLIVTIILAVMLYMTVVDICKGNIIIGILAIVLSAILLIVRKEFLKNTEETILIVKRKIWKENNQWKRKQRSSFFFYPQILFQLGFRLENNFTDTFISCVLGTCHSCGGRNPDAISLIVILK